MSSDRLIAAAQVLLSAIFIGGYFHLLNKFVNGDVAVPTEWEDQLGLLIGVLTAGVMLILQFWFSRQRPTQTKE